MLFGVSGCQSLVDVDVTYKECVPIAETSYATEFRAGTTLADLQDRCWHVENQGPAPGGLSEKIFVSDGDLVIRTVAPVDDDFDRWSGTDRGPMVSRRLEGEFVVVARAEALRKSVASHCLDPTEAAGLAVGQVDEPNAWATWLIEPFLWENGPKKAVCEEDTDDSNNATATGRGRSSLTGAEDFRIDDIGADGEVDIAICRVGSELSYFYRSGSDPKSPTWLQPKGGSHSFGNGPVEVGLTANGVDIDPLDSDPGFHTEAHFNWVVFREGSVADGCAGALESLTLPEGD